MRNSRNILGLFLCMALASCGKDDSKNKSDSGNGKISGNAFNLIDPGSLQVTENKISGTGKLIFSNPLKENESSYTFTLSLDNKASLELVANADKTLASGISFQFVREDKVLKASATVKGQTLDISEWFKGLDASKALPIVIDVHDEDPAHVLVWSGATKFTEESALFNSEVHVEMPGKGSGRFWGFNLNNAQVEAPTADEPKLSHHGH
jgi:hypothetical protein